MSIGTTDTYLVTLLDADGSPLSVPTECTGIANGGVTEICAHDGINAARDGFFTGAAVYHPASKRYGSGTAIDPDPVYANRSRFRGHLYISEWDD